MLDKKVASIALICLFASAPALSKSIKCVDSKGVAHYGDTIPPECANRPVIELDDNGLPMKENPASMTADERRAMEVEVQKAAGEAQKARDQKRRDSALLSTYASVAEIDMAKERNVKQLSVALESAESKLKIAKSRLDQYNVQAGSTRPVPADLAQNIAAAKKEISDLEVERAQKQQDLEDMKAKFDADKKRYQELTQKQPAQ